jgi:hypothetical protein
MNRLVAAAVNVHRESARQLEECLSRIARNLPAAAVTVFVNGDHGLSLTQMVERYGLRLVEGPNLGTNATWHFWWLRMLLFFRQEKAEVCFKFDPDTMVDATPRAIPNADYFGSIWLSRRYGIPFIQGGVTGLSGRAVCRLLDSGILLKGSACLPPVSEAWQGLADDQHLGLILARLGIAPVAWPECLSRWKTPVANEAQTHALVHPRYYP